jgi:beta-galactosidase GanA
MVYTVGAWLDDDSRHTLIEHITKTVGVEPVMQAPAGVEARKRIGEDGREVLILINHGQSSQVLTLPWPAVDHFTGAQDVMDVSLEPYAVCVFSRGRGDDEG